MKVTASIAAAASAVSSSLAQQQLQQSRVHPVAGYSDSENMWVKVCNLEKQEVNTNKYKNNRSEVTVQVSDKIFKLKKNSHYKNHTKLV